MGKKYKTEGNISLKNIFIGDYINHKMKNHELPYGMAYLNLLTKTEKKAQKAWKKFKKKYYEK